MLDFLYSDVTVMLGGGLLAILIAARAASSEKYYRSDLRGAISLLFAFLAFRVAAHFLGPSLSPPMLKGLTVAWMLTLAWGIVRAGVSTALYGMRLRRGRPTPKIVRDFLDFTLFGLAAVPILRSELRIDLTGLLATSAVLSVVIGLALQDTLGNFFAGLALQLERPFEVGDVVKIGEHTGTVLQIGWRATRIETFRQELITLPNNILSKEAVRNYNRGKHAEGIGVDTQLTLSAEVPPNVVKRAIREVIADVPQVAKHPPPVVRPIEFNELGIKYQIRLFVPDYPVGMDALDEFYSRLWYRLRRDGIEVPVPQRQLRGQPEDAPARELEHGALTSLLRSIDLFQGLAHAEHELLAREAPIKRFGRGEQIIAAGEKGAYSFYIVASGEVSVRTGADEAEVTRLRRGQYFGEMSLLTGEPRSATVVALTDAVMVEVNRATFARLFATYPELARQLSALLAQRRNELKVAAEKGGHPEVEVPEESHIFSRLRSIFGLGAA